MEGEGRQVTQSLKSQNERDTVLRLVTALKHCSQTRDLDKGLKLHLTAARIQCHTNKYVVSALITMYSKCGRMSSARDIFDNFPSRDTPMWNTIIMGYVENGESVTALELFTSIDTYPSPITYVAALKACSGLASERRKDFCLETGLALHRQLRELGYESNTIVANTLMDMYIRCGSMFHARDVFTRMNSRDTVSWNSLILGYVENGESTIAMEVFTSIDCKPDSVTFLAGLKACIGLASVNRTLCLQKGAEIHRRVRELGFDSELLVITTLLDMYTRCGEMSYAWDVFEGLPPERRSVVTWNCLISGYAENGESSRAMDLYRCMDCQPNSVTFLAVLKACTSMTSPGAGRTVHGRICRLGMDQDGNSMVTTSLVDFYGKCGNTAVAEAIFNGMSSPSSVTWNAMVTGYGSLGRTCEVFRLVWNMQEAEVDMDGITYLGVLAACAHAGMVEEGKKWFEVMCRRGISPEVEHYNCLVDMLGKANRLEEALAIAKSMPFKATDFTHGSLVRPAFAETNG